MKTLVLTLLAALAVATAVDAAPKRERVPFPKPSRDRVMAGIYDDAAVLKFTDGTAVRVRGSKFVIVESELELDRAARQGLSRAKLTAQLAVVNDMLGRNGASPERLLTASEDALRDERSRGEENSQQELPDLNLFFVVHFAGKTPAAIGDVLDTLNQLEIVEYAAPRPKGAPPPGDIPPTTPSYVANQTYFNAAPAGIDVGYARALPGGRGEGLRVVDVETGWIEGHEDAPTFVSTSGVNYSVVSFRYHGVATTGEIAAQENAYGMTGIAPSVEISMASPNTAGDVYNLPDGIQRAYSQSRAGDIILIEQQVYYNFPSDQAFCPPEWDPAAYSAVQNAVADHRIVIETAGNGSQNLDSAKFGTYFNRNVQDSGAIMVGAGSSSTHTPLSFTNYGSRLDVQGWGENIYTLGYGDLFRPNADDQQSYTAVFGGTSGAAPIVTGTAALIQSIRRGRSLPDLTSQGMRSALLVGATPQGAGVNIGPLPNLHAAIASIPVPAPLITATGSAAGSATVQWSAVPGVAGYEVYRRDAHTAAWALVTNTAATQITNGQLTAGKTYLYRVQAYDAAGNHSPDSNWELATTIDYADPQIVSFNTPVRAAHIVDVRTAVNSICTYAGTAICPSLPFTGNALIVAQVQNQPIAANDFTAVQSQIISLRSAIGASASTFRGTPATNVVIQRIHMEDPRSGAN